MLSHYVHLEKQEKILWKMVLSVRPDSPPTVFNEQKFLKKILKIKNSRKILADFFLGVSVLSPI